MQKEQGLQLLYRLLFNLDCESYWEDSSLLIILLDLLPQGFREEDPETDLSYLPVGALFGLLCYLDQKGLDPMIPGQNLLKMIPQSQF